jgi:hypothetical protein
VRREPLGHRHGWEQGGSRRGEKTLRREEEGKLRKGIFYRSRKSKKSKKITGGRREARPSSCSSFSLVQEVVREERVVTRRVSEGGWKEPGQRERKRREGVFFLVSARETHDDGGGLIAGSRRGK